MTQTRLGFVPILRPTFDVAFAEDVTARARRALDNINAVLVGPDRPLSTLEEARQAADVLAADTPDLVLVFQATFADSTMLTAIADVVDAPLALWAVPEPHTGGRLRLNSLCGVNLGAHALRRAGYRYHALYGAPEDTRVLDQIQVLLRAASVRSRLRQARIGQVGQPPDGFPTCEYDPLRLKSSTGVEVVPVGLKEQVFAPVQAVEPSTVAVVETALRQRIAGMDTVDRAATYRTMAAYTVLDRLAGAEDLSGLAIRCWPEFFTELGCAACGAVSMLTDAGRPSSCEADVNGTVTQLILHWLSDEPAFGADIVSIDPDDDTLILWHCGLAPLSMADPECQPTATIHSNRKLPLLMEFPLKPGVVTVARLSEATGTYRLVIGTGEIVRGSKAFSGTSGRLRMARPAEAVLQTILNEGLEHHIALTYGDHADALVALAQMLDLPVLQL